MDNILGSTQLVNKRSFVTFVDVFLKVHSVFNIVFVKMRYDSNSNKCIYRDDTHYKDQYLENNALKISLIFELDNCQRGSGSFVSATILPAKLQPIMTIIMH